MDRSGRFWDRIARRYARQPIADEATYQKKLEVTRGYFRPDMQVLEIGCGTGSTAIAHSPYVGQVHATDISSKMIEIARARAAEARVGNVSFAQSSVDGLDVEDRSVDVVLGLSVLHLLEDRDAAIARVHRMLVPGGVFVTSTMCLGDTMKYFALIAPVGRFFGLLPLLKIFRAEELEASFIDAGFAIDYRWQPDEGKPVFIVAKKAE